MKFTIFLCSAFIVSVACSTEADEPCLIRGGDELRDDMYQKYLDHAYEADIDKREHLFSLYLHATIKIIAAYRDASTDLPELLPLFSGGIEIECSEALADQVAAIAADYDDAVEAFEAENQTTTPQPTDE